MSSAQSAFVATAVTPTCEIVCPGCGRRRTVSERNARRNPATCMLCRNPSKRRAPDDSDRRFWLKRFSDLEIAEMAINIDGAADDIFEAALAEVRNWRSCLLERNGKVA